MNRKAVVLLVFLAVLCILPVNLVVSDDNSAIVDGPYPTKDFRIAAGTNYEDFVDQISDLHIEDADIGTHSDFAEEQDYDGSYDTLTEANTGGVTQVQYQASGAGAATITTSVTPAYPGSPSAGDLFLGVVMILDTTTAPSSFTGFTSLLGPYTSGTDGRVWIYYRYSTGSESGTTTVSRASGTTGFFAVIHSFRYVHQTIGSAYQAVNWIDEGSVSTCLDRGVTTTGNKELALNLVFNGEDTNTYVSFTSEAGGDWTEVVAQFSNGAGNDGTIQLQCATMVSAGTVDGGSFAIGGPDPLAVLGLALIPATTINYDLDLEVGWVAAQYSESNEYLCIYGGTQGAEALRVDVWSGSWINVISDLTASQWNNVSVSPYLTGSAFEIRFTDTSGESTLADAWQVDGVLLHCWTVLPETVNISQVLSMSETPSTIQSLSLVITEVLEASATPSLAMALLISFVQILGVAAAVSTQTAAVIMTFQAITIASVSSTAVSMTTTLNELLSLTSSAAANILTGQQYSIIINELLGMSSAISTAFHAFVGISEAIGFFDLVETMINPPIVLMLYALLPIGLSGIPTGGLEGVNIFYDLFFSANMWSYLGPMGLVVIGYFLAKKDKILGVLWFILECLFMAQYFTLVSANPAYWWQIFILLFGGLFTCVYPLWDR